MTVKEILDIASEAWYDPWAMQTMYDDEGNMIERERRDSLAEFIIRELGEGLVVGEGQEPLSDEEQCEQAICLLANGIHDLQQVRNAFATKISELENHAETE